MNPPGKKRWSAAPAVLLAWFAWFLVLPALAQGPLSPHADLEARRLKAKAELNEAAQRYEEAKKPFQAEVDRTANEFKAAPTDQAKKTAASQAEANLANDAQLKQLETVVADKQKALKELEDAQKAEAERLKTENEKIYEGTLALLTMFLVLAIVLENALEVIFKWRVFLARFSNRGMKAPIMVLAAGAMVLTFKLDILANLVAIYKSKGFQVPPEVKSNFFTGTISAFVLAGGSAGVNRLMVALGVRKESPPVVVPRPPDDKAWIAIKLNRVLAVGDLLVHLDKTPPSPPPAPAAPGAAPAAPAVPPNQLAGVIRTDLQSAREIMLRNKDRFPQNGGCEVDTVSTYKITVTGTSADGTPLKKELGPYSFAPGAIVDFNVTL